MSLLLPLFKKRRILRANHNYYENKILHPDRVMSEHDLIYMVEGEWEIHQEKEVFTLHCDDVLILWGGKHHYGTLPCREKTKTMFIHFSIAEGDLFEAGENADDCVTLPSLIRCNANQKVKLRLQELISVYFSSKDNPKLCVLLDLLLLDLAELARPNVNASDDLMEKLTLCMQSSPNRFFTAKDFSEMFFVGERTIRNRFQRAYHQTIYRYQMNLKLKMVHEFLEGNPDTTLYETAQNFGFCDEYHLSKQFKNQFGYTVTQLKQKIRAATHP